MTCTVGIYLFHNVEVLDFAGPFEVFTTASRMKARLTPEAPPLFNVFTVAASLDPIRARAGLTVLPQYDIQTHPTIDLLIIPGGIVTAELTQPAVIEWIARTANSAAITASVCTGAFLLAQAGLLQGKSATTHWEDLDDLQTAFPDIHVQADARWVDQGRIVTSAGISAGIEMSLHLVARLEGDELARRTARQMEYFN